MSRVTLLLIIAVWLVGMEQVQPNPQSPLVGANGVKPVGSVSVTTNSPLVSTMPMFCTINS